MFSKPFRIKSSSQMKSSDKKKLKSVLKAKYPNVSDEALAELIPNKEEVLVNKIYTYSGESLLLYISQRTPLFFELDKDKIVFPTVYALWRCPDLIPSFPTWPQILAKIANGADLMMPGIVVDHELGPQAFNNGKLEKGDPVFINTVINRAAVAVGRACLSSEDMFMSGRKGKGINVLHFYGDQLWASGTKQEPPELGPVPNLDFLKGEDANEGGDDDDENAADEGAVVEEVTAAVEDVKIQEEASEEQEDSRPANEVMDELLEHAFLQAWKTSAKKAELPMLTSNFFRLHMVPQCPKNKSLDVKKSSHKKLAKFLGEMQKRDIIQVAELQKGVDSITKVNLEHEDIKRFRVIKANAEEATEIEEVMPCDKPYEPPVFVEVFMVNGATAKLFAEMSVAKSTAMTASEVRDRIRQYVATQNLGNSENKALVNLNPVLAQAVLQKGENDLTSLTWDTLMTRVLSKMSPGYTMQLGDSPPSLHKGEIKKVNLKVVTRSGNKKVTLIENLEAHGISPKEFAHKCQVGVAASTSIQPSANSKLGMEVMVQGNQLRFITSLLLKDYKMPRKFIQGGDESKQKKKK